MRYVRIFGKSLISVGVGVLMFVGWTLYGTGFYTAHHQGLLFKEWTAQSPLKGSSAPGGGQLEFQGPPRDFHPRPGEPVFRMLIPKINLSCGGNRPGCMVVEGVDEETLKLGPGHYAACGPGFPPPLCTSFQEAWPGEKGRVIVSGHRTTYLHPFYSTDKLNNGDKIFIETKWGNFTYQVYDQRAVLPTDPNIVTQESREGQLVLTTCNPPYSASQRLITFARLVTS